MSDEEIEELTKPYLRRDLDEMAKELGLDPSAYPTKRAVAEAIVMARRARGREKRREEVVKMEKPLKGSVKDKVNDIKQFINENKQFAKSMQSKVEKMRSDIEETQSNMHKNAAAMIQDGVKAMQAGVKAMQAGVKETQGNFKQYAKDFYG